LEPEPTAPPARRRSGARCEGGGMHLLTCRPPISQRAPIGCTDVGVELRRHRAGWSAVAACKSSLQTIRAARCTRDAAGPVFAIALTSQCVQARRRGLVRGPTLGSWTTSSSGQSLWAARWTAGSRRFLRSTAGCSILHPRTSWMRRSLSRGSTRLARRRADMHSGAATADGCSSTSGRSEETPPRSDPSLARPQLPVNRMGNRVRQPPREGARRCLAYAADDRGVAP
jgi:hypothetical protein